MVLMANNNKYIFILIEPFITIADKKMQKGISSKNQKLKSLKLNSLYINNLVEID